MRSAFEVLAGEEEDADLATLAAQLGRVLYFMGRPEEALERIDLALTIAEALRLPGVLSEALNTRGLILTTHGRIEEGTLLLPGARDRPGARPVRLRVAGAQQRRGTGRQRGSMG
jgi:hypothetical protein